MILNFTRWISCNFIQILILQVLLGIYSTLLRNLTSNLKLYWYCNPNLFLTTLFHNSLEWWFTNKSRTVLLAQPFDKDNDDEAFANIRKFFCSQIKGGWQQYSVMCCKALWVHVCSKKESSYGLVLRHDLINQASSVQSTMTIWLQDKF